MLAVTDNAKQQLKETLLAHTNDPEFGLRLSLKPSGKLEIMLDKEGYGDQVIEHEGAKVLLVAPELTDVLEGITLDVQDTADGPKLVISKEQST